MSQTVTDLRLYRFRCYGDLRLKPENRAVVLTGPNGAGKTNILEALSFLGPGRGLRHAALDEVLQNTAKPGEGWAVSAVFDNARYGRMQIGTGLDTAKNRRLVKIDGEMQKGQAVLSEYLSVVWVTPQMDRLFLDGSALRRRFLDQVIFNFDPSHMGRLKRYEKALRDRSRLLRENGAHRADPVWLSSLETVMAEAALSIAAARLITVERLQKAAIENHLSSDIFPLPVIRIEGWVETALEEKPALEVEDGFRDLLEKSRARDAVTGGAEHGTHRSDFMVWHKGHNLLADQCSTGEQKGLLMAVTLAHARLVAAERGFAPLLLLDEMAAHLDEYRRGVLFDMVLAQGGQCWMTGTDRSIFAPLENKAQFFTLENAAIVENITPLDDPAAVLPEKKPEEDTGSGHEL
ncbi:MAG: DNA replication/repair protein RecF [Micavibrio sp.]|nr:MAG: DNA replication/repair protein RecF [Micavibrio sp.]